MHPYLRLSSRYCPVLSWVEVEAQPSADSINAVTKSAEQRLNKLIRYLDSIK